MPLGSFGKLKTAHLHDAVLLGLESNVDALINGQTSNLAEIVVTVRANGADAVGGEADSHRIFAIDGGKLFFTKHIHSSRFFQSN